MLLVSLGRYGVILAGWLLAMIPFAASAKYASIILDAETGRVIHEINANTRNYPASLTKMMTLYLMFEAIETGDMTESQPLKVSRRAAGQAPSKLGLKAGSTISAKDAIDALIVKSANDVATVVAEHLGGTEVKFAQLMTKKARELGMSRTIFRNASGLPNRGQLSTARDMATLAGRVRNDFPQYYERFSRTKFSFGGRTYRSHNSLLKSFDGADGLKTGYTRASGFNLATSAERDGTRLIGVVFGGKTGKARDRHMARLLREGFVDAAEFGRPILPTRKPLLVADRSGDVKPAEISVTPTRKPSQRKPANNARWGVQVGAFSISDVAIREARNAITLLKDELAGLMPHIDPLTRDGKPLFRAQILGLTKQGAALACATLEASQTGCMVLPPGAISLTQTAEASAP